MKHRSYDIVLILAAIGLIWSAAFDVGRYYGKKDAADMCVREGRFTTVDSVYMCDPAPAPRSLKEFL